MKQYFKIVLTPKRIVFKIFFLFPELGLFLLVCRFKIFGSGVPFLRAGAVGIDHKSAEAVVNKTEF